MLLDKRITEAMACVSGPEYDDISINVLTTANAILKELDDNFVIEFNDVNNCFHITGYLPEISRKIGVSYCGEPVRIAGCKIPHPAPLAVFITDTSNDDNKAIVEINLPDTTYYGDVVRIINGAYSSMKKLGTGDFDLDEAGLSCEITTNEDCECGTE